MILRLELPYINRMIAGGQVAKWHKQEGDLVDYGDVLLVIDGQPTAEALKAGQRPGPYPFAVVSSDRGTLRAIRATEGTTLGAGDLLAVLESGGPSSGPINEAGLASASLFRVVVDMDGQ